VDILEVNEWWFFAVNLTRILNMTTIHRLATFTWSWGFSCYRNIWTILLLLLLLLLLLRILIFRQSSLNGSVKQWKCKPAP
jgi:hypothetical protein